MVVPMATTVAAEVGLWTRLISSMFAGLRVSRVPKGFRSSLERLDLGGRTRLVRVDTSPMKVHRTTRLALDGCDDVLVLLSLQGTCSVEQEGRSTVSGVGSVSLHVADRPYILDYHDGPLSSALVLQFPRAMLPDSALLSPQVLRYAVDLRTPAAQIYSAFAREVFGVGSALPEARRNEMGRTAVDLTASLLCDLSDRLNGATAPALLRAIKSVVAERVTDPGLTPDLLAAQHNISLRYLQQLFAYEGTSPAAYIRHARLVRARGLLTASPTAGLSIASIAARVGFRDVGTFSRAFSRDFGTTPGAFRALHSRDLRQSAG
jgi:AraC-like DNA-binding protein